VFSESQFQRSELSAKITKAGAHTVEQYIINAQCSYKILIYTTVGSGQRTVTGAVGNGKHAVNGK